MCKRDAPPRDGLSQDRSRRRSTLSNYSNKRLTKTDMDEAEAIADLLAHQARAQDDSDERRKWRHWGPDIKELKPGSKVHPYSIAVRNMLRKRDEWSKRAVTTNLGNYDKLESQARAADEPVTVRTHAYTTKQTIGTMPRNQAYKETHFLARAAEAGKPSQHIPLPSKAAGCAG